MVKAIFNGVVIAETDHTEKVEGNHYFPIESIQMKYLSPTTTHTVCSWKGDCSYYTISVNDKTVPDCAWEYKNPKPAAANITGHIAFYTTRGVTIQM